MLSTAPLQCWDNSTRGLDAANAVEFCKTLRTATQYSGATACVAIYQSPQSAYDFFDKVTVLYEGYQIYFGDAIQAKTFFIEMGFECPEQQSTPDFLTSLTSAGERRVRKGYENTVPRSAEEFAARWKESDIYKKLVADIEVYNTKRFPIGGEALDRFLTSRRAQQAKHVYVTKCSCGSGTRLTTKHQPSQIPVYAVLRAADRPLSPPRLLATQGRSLAHNFPARR